ncbi:DUF1376 domain-containing protein [Ruegeria sp. HKCCSP351]|uniref:DUF1376 domain-containing protein n=1 Tax=Ruegeria sp. HKCCSP351 TaxID=2794832 RepID=UPI001AE8B568|nr:DUF1376 domain-containing protein [Ruegeria sp. HKCCSP351]
MSNFNAKRARTKRPCPLWVDAFQRDTQHLAADEVGAYMLILMAMWVRETCDFPDDDRRLAAVSRVSSRLWKSRIGSVIREFLKVDGGMLVSRRLRKEAAYVEQQVARQSNRKKGQNPDKPLKSKDTIATVDPSAEQPTQQPNNPNNSDTYVSAFADTVDFTKEVFDRGVAFLGKYGTPEPKARTLIGMWRKQSGDAATFNALRDASRMGVTEPVSWITAALKTNTSTKPDLDALMNGVSFGGHK